MTRFFTSECVGVGHPDVLVDSITDAVLDYLLDRDPDAHAGIEGFVTTDYLCLGGEIRTIAKVNESEIIQIVRKTINKVGYIPCEGSGFDSNCKIDYRIHTQSPDIAQGVDGSGSYGNGKVAAGDQGIMIGYACNDNEMFMPNTAYLARCLINVLREHFVLNKSPEFKPDSKTQVTIKEEDGVQTIDTVIVSQSHGQDVDIEVLREHITSLCKEELSSLGWDTTNTKFFINPTGKFSIYGPHGDSGVSGRKLIVDAYGPLVPIGGGNTHGKDPSKVDKSAAYAARWVCKNVVAAGLADKCQLEIAYAIGMPDPISIRIDTFGTEKYSIQNIEGAISKVLNRILLSISIS